MTNQEGKKKLRSNVFNYRFKEYISIQSESRSVPSLTETSPSPSSLVHATIFIPLPFHLIISIPCLVPGLFSPFPPILRTADFQQPIPSQPLPRPWLFRTVMRTSFTRPLNIAKNILSSLSLKILIEVRHNFQRR